MGNYKTSKIDPKIRGLCDFINSLKDTRTIGSCQGHDDNPTFDRPYVKFACANNRVLGFLVGIVDLSYSNPELLNDYGLNLRPKLKGCWTIEVEVGEGAEFSPEELRHDLRNIDEYACFVLHGLYDGKASDLYKDIKELEACYKKGIKFIPELSRTFEPDQNKF